jgi:hypothetical protein
LPRVGYSRPQLFTRLEGWNSKLNHVKGAGKPQF